MPLDIVLVMLLHIYEIQPLLLGNGRQRNGDGIVPRGSNEEHLDIASWQYVTDIVELEDCRNKGTVVGKAAPIRHEPAIERGKAV